MCIRDREKEARFNILAQVQPRSVRVSFPNMRLLNYHKLLTGPQRAIFRSTPVKVCMTCYEKLTETGIPVNKPDVDAQKAEYLKILAARPLERPDYLVDFNGLEHLPPVVANHRARSKTSMEDAKLVSPSEAFGPIANPINQGEQGYYEYSKNIERLQDLSLIHI